MRGISNYELEGLLKEGCGYSHFMGGTCSKNGKEIMDCSLGLFLFEEDEIGSDFYNQCRCVQQKAAKEYLNGISV